MRIIDPPAKDQLVRVRSRQYLVDEVVPPSAESAADTLVRLHCVEDDALGDPLEVLWEREVDASVIGASTWSDVAQRGFDDPSRFSAYLHTLKWNCVTATDPKLFQAPYRAGIEVKAYQLEPLRMALNMPRVNLFIADDVGLGKTIEAGLVLRELMMRQKVRTVVIAAPPSVITQWRDEMDRRFGLTFVVYDREFIASRRRERGYGVNPFTTHTRFILSHALLRDEAYAASLRDWLGTFAEGSLLVIDEAHNAAPASGTKYAVDSQLTRAVRDLAPRFEHKLFLSATPHNGHSNSFAALLEMLDPQRFCRGVPASPKLLESVMVRRLKADLRELESDICTRRVVPLVINGLPEAAPELVLSRLLQRYRETREERLAKAPRAAQQAAMLVVTSLQKRLLSSIEAFACTLRVHTQAIQRASEATPPAPSHLGLLVEAPGADDERADVDEAEVAAEESAQVEAASRGAGTPTKAELDLLDEMTQVAQRTRMEPDPRVRLLLAWIREHQCPALGMTDASWTPRRVLIFTEYADSKRYLLQQLTMALTGSDRADERVASFHGGMGEEAREEVRRRFNSEPATDPLRILVATDAAREGLNLQNHCYDLFHFDVPWNPSRMEQRNGRLDRKLQRSPVVNCHYFKLSQRPEDRVLDVLVRKTDTIQKELGAMSPVIDLRLSRLLERGIRHSEAEMLSASLDAVETAAPVATRAELDAVCKRRERLKANLEELSGLLDNARRWLGLSDAHFRDALSSALELAGAEPLTPLNAAEAATDASTARWVVPALDRRPGADPSWALTLDSLRPPRARTQKPWDWRRDAKVRPVIFRDAGTLDGDAVHLHLEHRLVQRLLSRFLAQGFVHNELTRACVVRTDEAVPKLLAIGRLSLYGPRATRLHDELVTVAADWRDPEVPGRRKLSALGEGRKDDVLKLLEDSLGSPRLRDVPGVVHNRLSAHAAQDVAELLPHLERRAETLAERAQRRLAERAEREAAEMVAVLTEQRARIKEQINQVEDPQLSLGLPGDELRQLESDRRYWPKRLARIDEELVTEPARIRATYEVKATRVEPAGLIYLWPVSM